MAWPQASGVVWASHQSHDELLHHEYEAVVLLPHELPVVPPTRLNGFISDDNVYVTICVVVGVVVVCVCPQRVIIPILIQGTMEPPQPPAADNLTPANLSSAAPHTQIKYYWSPITIIYSWLLTTPRSLLSTQPCWTAA